MATATLIQILSACTGIVGSLFFAIGVMRQSVETMGQLSQPYFDWNPNMVTALSRQKADYLFGGGLIVVAFLLQLCSFFAPNTNTLLDAESAHLAPWMAGLATVLVFFAFRKTAAVLAARYEMEVTAWLKVKCEEDAKKVAER